MSGIPRAFEPQGVRGFNLEDFPSETQWEYACRTGTKTPRYREDLNEIAWYSENNQGETHSVGQLVPSDWGLYDTLGNVFEGCEDVWTEDYNTKKDAAASAHRVIRGGSWRNDTQVHPHSMRSHRALVPVPRPGLPLCRVQS